MRLLLAITLLLAGSVMADVNLAVTCPAAKDGAARADCPAVSYQKPTASTLVRDMGTNTWRLFGSLLPADKIEVCASEALAGSLSDPSTGLPCTRWVSMFVSELSVAVPVTGQNTINVSWTPPTTNTDGSPVNLTGFRLYWGTVAGSLTQTVDVPARAAKYTLTQLPVGIIYVAGTALSADGESARSATVSGPSVAPAVPLPNAPVLKVQPADTNAYDLVKATNKLTLVSVGQVPAGTACVASTAVPAGFGIVDRAKVTLVAKTRPTVVVARCG